jgi:hypothetical protein
MEMSEITKKASEHLLIDHNSLGETIFLEDIFPNMNLWEMAFELLFEEL